MSTASLALARALRRSAIEAGCEPTIISVSGCPWASVTFAGERHHVVLAIPASTARYRWLAGLDETDLPMHGRIALPPTILSADDRTLELDVLTLEDD